MTFRRPDLRDLYDRYSAAPKRKAGHAEKREAMVSIRPPADWRMAFLYENNYVMGVYATSSRAPVDVCSQVSGEPLTECPGSYFERLKWGRPYAQPAVVTALPWQAGWNFESGLLSGFINLKTREINRL